MRAKPRKWNTTTRNHARRADAIIQKTGYQAALKTSALPEMQPENASLWRSHWRTWLLLALAAPFMLGMVGMLIGSHALMPPAWLQIALASIVQLWLAVPFYKSAIAACAAALANMDVCLVPWQR